MVSCIFYLTDSLRTMTAVLGTGETKSAAEADALVLWDTTFSGRTDYAERTPIIEIIDSGLSTELGNNSMPGLVL